MNKNVEFAERTGTSLKVGASKEELFEYASQLHKKLEEEVAEMFDALVAKDVTELLDACKDINVYRDQFKDSLIKAGIDVNGAQEAVALNNELKYTTSFSLAMDWLEQHRKSGSKGYEIHGITVDDTTYYCIKNQDNKVIKPIGHCPVCLLSFIPSSLLQTEDYVWGSQEEDVFDGHK